LLTLRDDDLAGTSLWLLNCPRRRTSPLSGTCNPPAMLSWVDASSNPGFDDRPVISDIIHVLKVASDGRMIPRWQCDSRLQSVSSLGDARMVALSRPKS
jgi:hypothetical protein